MLNRYQTNLYGVSKRNVFNKYEINNLRFALFPRDNAVTWTIIKGIQYEPYIFEFFYDNKINLDGFEIVDAGANNGSFTVDFAILVGNKGKVYSFEPQRIIYYQLCANTFLNGLDNVYCYNVALDQTEGRSKVQKPDYFSQSNVNFGDVRVDYKLDKQYELVECRRLDSYKFDKLKFIKIDTQGYELFILKGAVETIQKHRPFIILEIEEVYLKLWGLGHSDIENYFKGLDYTLYQLKKGIPFSTSTGFCLDHVAIPNELNPESFIIP